MLKGKTRGGEDKHWNAASWRIFASKLNFHWLQGKEVDGWMQKEVKYLKGRGKEANFRLAKMHHSVRKVPEDDEICPCLLLDIF